MSLFVFTLAFPGSHTLTAAPGGVTEQRQQVRTVCMSQRADTVFSLPLYFCVLVRACRWILAESGSARYLHSAALLSGTVLVFGGNTHNDTSQSNGAKCFSADFLAYDVGESNFQTACLFVYFKSCPLWIFRARDNNQTTRVSHVDCLLRHSQALKTAVFWFYTVVCVAGYWKLNNFKVDCPYTTQTTPPTTGLAGNYTVFNTPFSQLSHLDMLFSKKENGKNRCKQGLEHGIEG